MSIFKPLIIKCQLWKIYRKQRKALKFCCRPVLRVYKHHLDTLEQNHSSSHNSQFGPRQMVCLGKITILSDGPISATLISVKISWLTCQNGDKKSPLFSYFWIFFEDKMTIFTFLMLPACLWTIFDACIKKNHRGALG